MIGLYILFEGLPDTVIEAVTLRHIKAMSRYYGVTFELFTFACTQRVWEESLANLDRAREVAGCEISLLRGWRPGLPGSLRLNGARLCAALAARPHSFDFIHARTDYSAAVAGTLPGRQRPPVLWDCRGDSRAEILDGKGQAAGWRGLAAPAKFWASRRDLRLAARHADTAIFVSAPLREQYVTQLRPDTPQIIAPNCADEDLFFYSPELRKQVRADFGIAPNELLFVYSGTVKHYQNIETMFHWYAAHARNLQESRMLIATPTPDVVLKLARSTSLSEHVIALSARHEDVNRYMNAADAAFMLRDSIATNRVASPTKFAEYCLAGLPVIMTEAVKDAYALAQRLGNCVDKDDPEAIRLIASTNRETVASSAREILGRQAQIEAIYQLYRHMVHPTAE